MNFNEIRSEYFLEHRVLQSCGWVKIAEYACTNLEQVDATKKRLIAEFPTDTPLFTVRG